MINKAIRDYLLEMDRAFSQKEMSVAIELLYDPRSDGITLSKISERHNLNVTESIKIQEKILSLMKSKEIDKDDKYIDRIRSLLDTITEITKVKYPSAGHGITIRSRLAEGYHHDELLAIIHLKAQEWQGTEFFRYLRPETLFSKKNTEKYLNEVRFKMIKTDSDDKRIDSLAETISRAKARI